MNENAVTMRNVSVVRDGGYILDHIDLDIRYGENVAILGANGSGKTTLMKLLTGDVRPYYEEDGSAHMFMFGKENWNIFELRDRIGIVSMDLQNRFDGSAIVSDIITSGYFSSMDIFRNHRVTEDMVRSVYNAALRLGVEDLLDRPIESMSLGEMRRVLIARALVTEPDMLVLDEPMTGLDIVMKDTFRKMFDILSASGVNIVMITHELEDIPPCVGRVIMIKDGKKIFDGRKDLVLTSDNLSHLFDADIRVSMDGHGYHMYMDGDG